MTFERFEEIVEAAKQQELEIEGQKQLIEQLERKIKEKEIVPIKGGSVEVQMNKFGERPRIVSEDTKHDDLTQGIIGLTSKADLKGKIMAKVHFKHPVTGRDTTKSAVRPTLIEAIIARNEIAASLLRGGWINMEQFKRYTSF